MTGPRARRSARRSAPPARAAGRPRGECAGGRDGLALGASSGQRGAGPRRQRADGQASWALRTVRPGSSNQQQYATLAGRRCAGRRRRTDSTAARCAHRARRCCSSACGSRTAPPTSRGGALPRNPQWPDDDSREPDRQQTRLQGGGDGGGIINFAAISGRRRLTLINTTVAFARLAGGIMAMDRLYAVNLINSTVARNTATDRGVGGVAFPASGQFRIGNSSRRQRGGRNVELRRSGAVLRWQPSSRPRIAGSPQRPICATRPGPVR